jgi:hypothetical protein
MTEQELRELVRDVLARRSTGGAGPPVGMQTSLAFDRRHASHLLLPVASGGDGDGACLIEPNVRCNHCGYCLSYGH